MAIKAANQRAQARVGRSRRVSFARHPGDVLRLVLGALALALTTSAVEPDRVGVHEENLFRLINDLPLQGWLGALVWTGMQLGNLGVVPATVFAAAVTRRWRLAFDFAVAGGTIYLVSKLIKGLVQRGRPQHLLEDVHIHGEAAGGLGYVSGHAAVAVALATVASPYLGRRGRRIAWALASVVCVARVWVGAHLPLDVLGGAVLGWIAGVIVHLLLGAPGGRPSAKPVRRALEDSGLDPVDVQPLGGVDARRSAYFRAATGSGPDLFVKVVPRERRDSDLLYRAWRRALGRRGGEREHRGPPPQQVAQEAAMALMAGAAGVQTPPVVLARAFGNGAGLFVHSWVPGRGLAEVPAEDLQDATLVDVWRQLAALRRARIAHRDLQPSSIVVDEEGRAWVVDFDRATAAATPGQLDADLADLLVTLAGLAGPERAVRTAAAALGPDLLGQAAGALRAPARLSPAARQALRAHPELGRELLDRLAAPARR